MRNRFYKATTFPLDSEFVRPLILELPASPTVGSISLEESHIILSPDLWTFLFLIAVFTSLDSWCGKAHSHPRLYRNVGPTPLLTGLWLLFVEEWLALLICYLCVLPSRNPPWELTFMSLMNFSIGGVSLCNQLLPGGPTLQWGGKGTSQVHFIPHLTVGEKMCLCV